jgi:hypothetical protein
MADQAALARLAWRQGAMATDIVEAAVGGWIGGRHGQECHVAVEAHHTWIKKVWRCRLSWR